jgi:hypothetical protein
MQVWRVAAPILAFAHINLRTVTMTKTFAQLANWVAVMSGHPAVFGFAILTVVAWMVTQGNRVKERMLNPIEQFFAPSRVLDSHRAKLRSATQSP